MSRPSKITASLIGLIAQSARADRTAAAVASDAGIGERTLYRWLARGRANRRCANCPCRSMCTRQSEEPFVELAERVTEAQGELRAEQIRVRAQRVYDAQLQALLRFSGKATARTGDAWPMPPGGAP